jgi:hypothetical protein
VKVNMNRYFATCLPWQEAILVLFLCVAFPWTTKFNELFHRLQKFGYPYLFNQIVVWFMSWTFYDEKNDYVNTIENEVTFSFLIFPHVFLICVILVCMIHCFSIPLLTEWFDGINGAHTHPPNIRINDNVRIWAYISVVLMMNVLFHWLIVFLIHKIHPQLEEDVFWLHKLIFVTMGLDTCFQMFTCMSLMDLFTYYTTHGKPKRTWAKLFNIVEVGLFKDIKNRIILNTKLSVFYWFVAWVSNDVSLLVSASLVPIAIIFFECNFDTIYDIYNRFNDFYDTYRQRFFKKFPVDFPILLHQVDNNQ